MQFDSLLVLLLVHCGFINANIIAFGTPDASLEICYRRRVLKGTRNPFSFSFHNVSNNNRGSDYNSIFLMFQNPVLCSLCSIP